MVWKYTDLFDEKTAANGVQKKLIFLLSLPNDDNNDIAKKVVDYLPNYQNYIEDLKKEGYIIVGYARKSTTNEDDDSRVRLLSQMIRRLRERSLVDKVFVSPRTNANDLMVDRDLVKNEELSRQLNTCGDAQDLLNYVSQNEKICLVILGYAGLSTNCKDLEVFLRNSKNIRKIVVDHLPFDNTIRIHDCCELLQDPKKWRFSIVEQEHTRDQIHQYYIILNTYALLCI
ncbi:hypothetical protein FB192DRAFT_1337872 [Mucor lusitanicus]|uniref:Uncharacterized protein n=1 Tax=Mucor circinelloides f. lusitanicus TaxID=29924 RepID=A0A8H4BQV4_MUCCL|nr:hypothetical protein FB192DRAFT_1337872 [Mucor lusitanicus]